MNEFTFRCENCNGSLSILDFVRMIRFCSKKCYDEYVDI